MSDPASYVAMAVVTAQLGLPFVIGVPPIFKEGDWDDAPSADGAEGNGKRSRRRRKQQPKSTAPRLVPLTCPSCSAPVALEANAFPCPHCGAPIHPPPEYVAALEDGRQAEQDLQRAERVWRWSRWTSARPFVWFLRLLTVGWLALVCASGLQLDDDWPAPLLVLVAILALIATIIGLLSLSVLDDARQQLPPLPQRHELQVPLKSSPCQSCGAPITFPAGRLGTVCPYCRGENYRAGLARAQAQSATGDRQEAARSLHQAVISLDERKRNFVLFFAFLAAAELLFAVAIGGFALKAAIFGD